jgi:nitronate monooxygenase
MALRSSPLARQLGVEVPIVQAPMAGGPSTPGLAAAVSQAGGLGSVAGAMLEPESLRAAIRETRSLTDRPFAVNLFAPLPEPSMRHTAEWARLTGRPVPTVKPAPRFADQLAVVAEERVPVFSFTFGIPPLDGVEAFTIGTATTVAEAVELEKAGVNAVVAQGFEAGGHRGTFLQPVEHSLVGTLALVPQIVDAVSVPVLAAGGIMDGRGVAAALVLGAGGVQLGTAFLPTDEAGTSPAHRNALSQDTTLTRVLTGRYARAVRTPVVERLEAAGQEPPDYPLPRFFLSEPPMLVGQGGPLARSLPAGELVSRLITETDAAIAAMCARTS